MRQFARAQESSQNEEQIMLLRAATATLPPNPEDSKDKGMTPSTVQRRSTDVVWNFPFCLLLGICSCITYRALKIGRPETMFKLPDHAAHLCGTGRNVRANFLYFCMTRESQDIFNGSDKLLKLEQRYPICVDRCPESFNTSSRCFTGEGQRNDVDSWESIQDYPTQPMAYFCRPHRKSANDLADDFWLAVSKGPWTSYLLLAFYSAWPLIPAVAISSSAVFSFFYLISLSKYARTLIWLSLAGILLFASGTSIFYGYCFKSGHCREWIGHGKEEPMDFLRCVTLGIVAIYILRTMSGLSSKLESVGRIMEMSCRCILSTPSIATLPMLLLAFRIALTGWLVYVILCLYGYEMQDELNGVEDPWVSKWSQIPSLDNHPEFWMYMIILIFSYTWALGTITAIFWFVMFYVGQAWYFSRQKKKSAHFCNVPKAFHSCLCYHSGTMILAGLLHILVGPLHATVGRLQEGRNAGNPIANLLHTCLFGCMDCYAESLAHLSGNALQDVSLQAFDFFESAEHMAEKESGASLAEEVEILNTSTFLFQVAGVGSACVIAWFAIARVLSYEEFTDEDSPRYVRDKMLLSFGGVFLSFLSALPFMTTLDVVSDALLYSQVVEQQRNPVQSQVEEAANKLMRNCMPWGQVMRDITSCHCGSRNPENSQGFSMLDWGSMMWQVEGSPSMPAILNDSANPAG